MEIIFT